MIKATGRDPLGRPLLVLGLSGENVTRLMAGEPIPVDTTELGFGGPSGALQVLILGGRTEDDITGQLEAAGLVGPETERRGPGS